MDILSLFVNLFFFVWFARHDLYGIVAEFFGVKNILRIKKKILKKVGSFIFLFPTFVVPK